MVSVPVSTVQLVPWATGMGSDVGLTHEATGMSLK